MKIRRKVGRKIVDAALTTAAYTLIGIEVARHRVTKDNIAKVASRVKIGAQSTGKVATQSGRSILKAATQAKVAIQRRKIEIQGGKSDQPRLPY